MTNPFDVGTIDHEAWAKLEYDSWPDPIPLTSRSTKPAFPVGVFPPWVADMINAVAVFTQTDPAMAGSVALSVLAACAGGRLEVEARPGWREPTNLFVAVVAAPGERKSPVQVALTAPLRAAEKAMVAAALPGIAEAEVFRDIAARSAEKAKTEAARVEPVPEKRKERDKLNAAAAAAMMDVEAITVPTVPRLMADDATPEALSSLMAANAGRIALISDEGGIFDILGGRYSSVPNLDPLLKGHAGTPMRVDRKGRPPEHIEKPALTVAVMVQPAVLRDVGANAKFRGRGLLARFLFVLPTSKVGHRKVNPPSVPSEVAELYSDNVQLLATTLAGWTDPAVVPITDAARDVLEKAQQIVEDKMAPGGSFAHVADWANKMVGMMLRIAGLLHVARHPEDAWRKPLDAEVMTDAVSLAGVFAGHYQSAVEVIGADPTVEAARYVLDVITRMDGTRHSVRDIFNRCAKSRFPKVGDLGPALTLLQEHHWLQLEPPEDRDGKPGRPGSPTYAVNPKTGSAISAHSAEPPSSADNADIAEPDGRS